MSQSTARSLLSSKIGSLCGDSDCDASYSACFFTSLKLENDIYKRINIDAKFREKKSVDYEM